MKNIFILLLLLPSIVFGQDQKNEYVHVVKKFYKLIFLGEATIKEFSTVYSQASLYYDTWEYLKDSLDLSYIPYNLRNERESRINVCITPSYVYKKMKPFSHYLTNSLSYEDISNIIDSGIVINDGLQFTDYFQIKFPQNISIYFELGIDSPSKIEYVWMSDGTSFEDKFHNVQNLQKLLLVGSIDERDSVVIIRQNPTEDSKIVDKITSQEFFYYVPNSELDWWEVSRNDDYKLILGYIHKSKIVSFIDLPTELKLLILEKRYK